MVTARLVAACWRYLAMLTDSYTTVTVAEWSLLSQTHDPGRHRQSCDVVEESQHSQRRRVGWRWWWWPGWIWQATTRWFAEKVSINNEYDNDDSLSLGCREKVMLMYSVIFIGDVTNARYAYTSE